MTHKRIWLAIGLGLVFGLAGCGPAPSTPSEAIVPAQLTQPPTQAPAATTEVPTPAPTIEFEALTVAPLIPTFIPTLIEEQPVTPLPKTPPPSGADPDNQWVRLAKEDLAKRLSVEAAQIVTIEFRSVVWPDGSAGCPQPGMNYIQVLVEGYLIRLGVGKRTFEYHGQADREPFLCENPTAPLPGSGDT